MHLPFAQKDFRPQILAVKASRYCVQHFANSKGLLVLPPSTSRIIFNAMWQGHLDLRCSIEPNFNEFRAEYSVRYNPQNRGAILCEPGIGRTVTIMPNTTWRETHEPIPETDGK
jgi:hypothetical protein